MSAAGLPVSAKHNATSTVEDEEEAENLKNDIALKRLLAESHLLDPVTSGDGGGGVRDFNLMGVNRHKALDLRFQALGSATSIYKQEKMPMSHRKGLIKKAQYKEEKRRKGVKKERERRERGVGGPTVGRFKGGMLMLSKKDVASIEGRKERVGSKRMKMK